MGTACPALLGADFGNLCVDSALLNRAGRPLNSQLVSTCETTGIESLNELKSVGAGHRRSLRFKASGSQRIRREQYMCAQNLKPTSIAALVLFAAVCQTPSTARAADAELGRFWGNFGLGYGSMQTSSGAGTPGGSGLWLDVVAGARISDQWLLGLDIGGLGLHMSGGNYEPCGCNDSIYGEAITNVFLAFQYEPKSDHGWFLGAGAGEVLYSNKFLQDLTGNSRSGSGHGGLVRVGYDWPTAARWHVEAALSYERGAVGMYAPVSGDFNFSIVAASFHVAYH
jgi:hypothetical protein